MGGAFRGLWFLLLLLPMTMQIAQAEDWVYRLHKGENLTLVAERFLKPRFTPEQLQVYNGIVKDREMPVGTEIRVPMDWLKLSLAGVRVRYVVGEASLYRRGRDRPDDLAIGDDLEVGDRVVTRERSAASFLFADGSYLLVGPGSEVVFDALSTYQGQGMLDTRIRLQRGRVENRVKPLSDPDARFEIHTPAAVTVVRGTEFRVAADEDGSSRSEVTGGRVNVSAAGETVPVTAGEGTRVEPGQPPAPPRKLLPAPDLSSLEIPVAGSATTLRWPALKGAQAYRVQLMNDQETPELSRQVDVPAVELPPLDAGVYQLRVRGIDELRLEGLVAARSFDLAVATTGDPRPSTAPLLSPPRFLGGWFDVSWRPAEGAWAHRLVLARDPGFRLRLLDQLSQGDHYRLALPPPGTYFLAVEALYEANGGARSKVYRIEVP